MNAASISPRATSRSRLRGAVRPHARQSGLNRHSPSVRTAVTGPGGRNSSTSWNVGRFVVRTCPGEFPARSRSATQSCARGSCRARSGSRGTSARLAEEDVVRRTAPTVVRRRTRRPACRGPRAGSSRRRAVPILACPRLRGVEALAPAPDLPEGTHGAALRGRVALETVGGVAAGAGSRAGARGRDRSGIRRSIPPRRGRRGHSSRSCCCRSQPRATSPSARSVSQS